jgi:STE24 endopeptidase
MTPMLFVTDTLKGWLLGLVFGAPFLACFLWIVRWAGNRFVPWLMTFMFVHSVFISFNTADPAPASIAFQLIMVVLYPTVIQPLFNKLSPLPQDALRTRIEALATRLKFPLKHLYVIDGSKRSSHSNAYFYGLPWVRFLSLYTYFQ